MLDPTYRPGPGTPSLVLTRDYRRPPEQLWAAVSTPERIAAWMGVEWRGDAELKLGARFSYLFKGPGLLTEVRVTAFEPGRRLAHTWFENTPGGEAEIRWEVEPAPGGSRLTLTHIFTGVMDDAARTGVGWSQLLDALARGLGEPSDPQDALDWPDRRRRLWGLLPPEALRDGRGSRRPDGGWTLTFDRRLPHPLAKVWRAVSTPEGVGAWMLADAIVEGRVGGRYRLAFHGFDRAVDGRITAFEPERRIAYTWPEGEGRPPAHVSIDLQAEGAGATRLVLTHDLPEGSRLFAYAAGWHWHLDQAEATLAGAKPVRQRAREDALRVVYRMVLFSGTAWSAPLEALASAA